MFPEYRFTVPGCCSGVMLFGRNIRPQNPSHFVTPLMY
jgi:hypothetical protein